MQDTKIGNDVGMRVARQRLFNRDDKGKEKTLCLACGEPATNALPSCNSLKCRKAVRPVYRWAKKVCDLTTTRGNKQERKAA